MYDMVTISACVGISDKAFIGVDIERVKNFPDCYVNMFYTKENAETINCMDGIGQTEMWCIQEAYLKAMGMGFEVGLKGLHMRLADLEQCDAKVIIKNNIFDHASSGLSDDALISIIVCLSNPLLIPARTFT